MLKPQDFFDLEGNRFSSIFEGVEYVWEALRKTNRYIKEQISPNVSSLRKDGVLVKKTLILYEGNILESGFVIENVSIGKKGFVVKKDGEEVQDASIVYAGVYLMDDDIEIGKGVVIEPGALIKGPTIIENNTEIRQGAYIRGNVIIGAGCVVGHTTEVKSSVMLGESKAGHFAYIGDSILGRVNLGAGTKLANLKITESEVVLKINGKQYKTGLRKFGAILADGVETGCNTVTTPGTLLGKGVLVYPNAMVKGYYPANTIVKLRQTHNLEKKGK